MKYWICFKEEITVEKNKVYGFIDELLEEVNNSKNSMLSKNKSVDPVIIEEIVEDIRKAMDDEFEHAREIESQRDQILKAAQLRATEIVKEANAQAAKLIDENAITLAAREKAQKMLDKARSEAMTVKDGANTYAAEIFADLEDYYKESLDLVKENRLSLRGKMGEGKN
jgi:hypothetical protein